MCLFPADFTCRQAGRQVEKVCQRKNILHAKSSFSIKTTKMNQNCFEHSTKKNVFKPRRKKHYRKKSIHLS
jgi:hypothetical protein